MGASIRACCFLMGLIFASSVQAGLEVQRLHRPFALGESQGLRIEAPAGALTTETWDDDSVAIEVALECSGDVSPCRSAARRVALASEKDGETLVIRMTGPWTAEDMKRSKAKILKTQGWYLTAEIKIFYPASKHLEVKLEQGVVEVRGLESDGKIEVARGTATVTMKKRDAGSLVLSCAQGDAVIRSSGEKLLRGKERLEWHEGDGECDLEIDLGEGAIVVDLI